MLPAFPKCASAQIATPPDEDLPPVVVSLLNFWLQHHRITKLSAERNISTAQHTAIPVCGKEMAAFSQRDLERHSLIQEWYERRLGVAANDSTVCAQRRQHIKLLKLSELVDYL